MKNVIGIVSFLSLILMLQIGATSCTKDNTIYKTDTLMVIKKDTLTVVQKDTVIIKDTAITLQLLTSKSWVMQEIRGVQGNNLLYYKRGGTSNTESFDADHIKFDANKTGTYVDGNGATHQISWDFSNSDNTKLTFIVSNPVPLTSQTVVYDNLRYKNGVLLFDQYWTYNNINSHAQAIRTPSVN